MKTNLNQQWFTVSEIADYLRVAPITIYRWLEQGHIPAHRIGRQWRFNVHEIGEWISTGSAANNFRSGTEAHLGPKDQKTS